MSYLEKLPAEIQVSIANACSAVDIKRLCETCHLLSDRLASCPNLNLRRSQLTYPSQLPKLYRTVDLSSHNVNKICEPWGRDAHEEDVSPTFSERH
jgi:hypothetical protein